MNRPQLAATAVAGALFLLVSAVGCGSADPVTLSAATAVTATAAPSTTAPTTAPTSAPVTPTLEPVVAPAAVAVPSAPVAPRIPATTRAATPKPVQALVVAPKPAPKAAVKAAPIPKPAPKPAPKPKPVVSSAGGCNSNYTPCVPNDPKDVDCQGGSGNGPSYVKGPVTVTGTDVYGLDADKDGIGCE